MVRYLYDFIKELFFKFLVCGSGLLGEKTSIYFVDIVKIR